MSTSGVCIALSSTLVLLAGADGAVALLRHGFALPPPWHAWGLAAMAALALATGAVLSGDWATAIAATVAALYLGMQAWNSWKRRRRDRARRSLGAKSKALRDALVRRVREVATPRPVLKPAPVPR